MTRAHDRTPWWGDRTLFDLIAAGLTLALLFLLLAHA